MATYLDGGVGHIAWNGDGYKTNDKERDKYFDKDRKGNYVLKEGYESRYLGSGDNVSRQGAVSTYTNAYDDMWDSYDPNRDKKNYGIYKIQQPQVQTVVKQAPSAAPKKPNPTPKPKAGPIEHSPEIQQAKERVSTYEDNLMSGKTADEIFQVEPTQDYSKDTYISTSDNQSNDRQYDFSAKTFNADTKKAQDFLTRKLSNYTNSVPPVDISPV